MGTPTPHPQFDCSVLLPPDSHFGLKLIISPLKSATLSSQQGRPTGWHSSVNNGAIFLG